MVARLQNGPGDPCLRVFSLQLAPSHIEEADLRIEY